MNGIRCAVLCLAAWLGAGASWALVRYDEGRRVVKGVQLLQDASDPNVYYYVPQFPRLSTREDGTFEILCLKYVDPAGTASGGLFHALIEFSLPPELLAELEKELKKQVPGARIAGPVPLLQAVEDGEEGVGSFRVVSGVLSNKEAGGFAQSVVTSGRAPLLPGSKAVIAAILNQQGATLLWNSLTGGTSDVSVAISASFEAAVQNYNARVTADVSTVYKHFSQIANGQKSYTRRQMRNVVDELQRTGDLKVEVMDRSAGLGIKATEMEGILQVVTSKLTETMFDHTTGWSADPARETAVEDGQIQGRQDRGWLGRIFGGGVLGSFLHGPSDSKYYTDDQYVLKSRKDIRHNVFTLVLTKNSTIRVPVDTAGNLGGLYGALGQDARYFRVVSLADPAFEFRSVHFQVDGEYLDSFQDTVNFVSVNLRKTYPGQPAFIRSLRFSQADLKAGKTVQDLALPRLGLMAADWAQYEYQVRWSLRDGPTVSVPPQEDRWVRGSDPAVSLLPPFARRVIEIDADRQLFAPSGVATAVVEFATMLAGKPKLVTRATLRATDAAPTTKLAIYHDRGTPVAVRVSWFSTSGRMAGKLQPLDTDYILLTPPAAVSPGGTE
jgi:hypothetical protein